ncbi:MAG: S8 family serine peptidase [Chthoniobacteraceae bacterium]|nr:S8 family serine peptidase [Chthoniobacteraceae bacterium]
MRFTRTSTFALSIALWLTAAFTAPALDYSVPYVRNGLPYFGDTTILGGVAGYGAIVGQIEVRDTASEYPNGIDGFDGHRQDGLGPDPGSLYYGLWGYQDVKDFTGMGAPADSNGHGTFVAGVMASEYELTTETGETVSFMGVAPLARYYGAIFDGSDSKQAFLSLNDSLHYLTQVVGASVINNSWGSDTATLTAADLNGNSAISLLVDEYVGYSGKTGGTTGKYLDKLMVISAGNSGQTNGLLGMPADSYNSLVVGALNVVNPAATELLDPTRSPSAQVAPYSSWRPLADGRAGVDVVAPGTDIWSTLAINATGSNGYIAGTSSGTSYAAPHVTGVAALLYGLASNSTAIGDDTTGYVMVSQGDLKSSKGTLLSTDHKLIKALIINSAQKIPGLDATGAQQSTWQPGQVTTTNGVPNAVVPLNYAVGAGSVDAMEAVRQYDEEGNRFWDLNALRVVGSDQYYTFGLGKFVSNPDVESFLTGLTATLVWDRHVDFVVDSDPNSLIAGTPTTNGLSNLDLILQEEVAPGVWQDVYMSAGTLDNLEHIYLPVLTGTNNYRLDVRAESLTDPEEGETYALVVSYTTSSSVPEPGVWGLLALGLAILAYGAKKHSWHRVVLRCRITRL